MREWLARTDEFLKFVDKPALKSSGRVTHEQAVKRAIEEYNKFREKQAEDYISQFDMALEKYLSGDSDQITHFKNRIKIAITDNADVLKLKAYNAATWLMEVL